MSASAFPAKEKEPITPFLFRVKRLFTELDISTIMVIGGSGDFFEVADLVLQFDKYQAYSVTNQAKAIAQEFENSSAGKVRFEQKERCVTADDGAASLRHYLLEAGLWQLGTTLRLAFLFPSLNMMRI